MAYYSLKIKEGEIKNKVRNDWFSLYDATREIGNIDFAVYENEELSLLSEPEPYLWAESKQGERHDPAKSIVQLLLTIGKDNLHAKMLQPALIAAFDARRICFLEYSKVMHIFSQSWVNWTITPSEHDNEHFIRVYDYLKDTINSNFIIFEWDKDKKALQAFIKNNFRKGKSKTAKIKVNRTNFTYVYYRWCDEVKQSIRIDWELMKKNGLFDHDFFLADLMSDNGVSVRENLAVVLQQTRYKVKRDIDGMGFFKEVEFKDKQQAYNRFWNSYERPPKEEYRKYILDRADLLVPQNIREVEGSFYTPRIWVEESQKYLADVFGEMWQEEYYIWDVAAGSGNLLRGLTNRWHVWASTLNQSDVDIMRDSAINNEFNMLPEHIFQFDFLNDDLNDIKVPASLRDVLSDPQKRSKLIIYINPPFKEPTDAKQVAGTGQNVESLANSTLIYKRYSKSVGTAVRELFVQFLLRIYREIPDSIIGCFSTLKHLQASNFVKFRRQFNMELRKAFLVPGQTFDNVDSKFPICFQVWTRSERLYFDNILVDALEPKGHIVDSFHLTNYDAHQLIIKWLQDYYDKKNEKIGYLILMGTDIYHNRYISISNRLTPNEQLKHLYTPITSNNLFPMVVYYSVRNVIANTWINNRDQYVAPTADWQNDRFFQTDCLICALFQNNVRIEGGSNNWIPFSERDLNARDSFQSSFMYRFLDGRVNQTPVHYDKDSLFGELEAQENSNWRPFDYFTDEANAVYNSGKELWKYYLAQPDSNINAGLYDIKLYFQGYKGNTNKMNKTSDDERYTELRNNLNLALDHLRRSIKHKVYEYQFLIK